MYWLSACRVGISNSSIAVVDPDAIVTSIPLVPGLIDSSIGIEEPNGCGCKVRRHKFTTQSVRSERKVGRREFAQSANLGKAANPPHYARLESFE
ncbi:hypothetical protein BST61_g7379 [Cercospora zeina]